MSRKSNAKVIEYPEGQEPQFRMIDVGAKRVTRRRAVACGTIVTGVEAFGKIRDKTLPKGDVLALAEVAGIMGAKKTPDLIPMCHTLPLDQVGVHCVLRAPDAVDVYCQVVAHAKTGVEMEAIAGVQAALATIWDLTKGTNPALSIGGVKLLVKEGGKSGLWLNPDGVPEWLLEQFGNQKPLQGKKAAIIVMSDRASAGEYQDRSGPVLREILEHAGAVIVNQTVIPDSMAEIERNLKETALSLRLDFIITSGGTGLSARDVTPDALARISDRIIPGFGELLRQDGAQVTPMSWLSRSIAGLIGHTLVITLPGSPKAVREGMEALLPHVLPHALSMIEGGKH